MLQAPTAVVRVSRPSGRASVGLVSSVGLHTLIGLLIVMPWASGVPARLAAPAGPPISVVLVPAEDPAFLGLRPIADEDRAAGAHVFARGTLAIREATFDLQKIASRIDVLFPFVTPGVALELFRLTRDEPVFGLENPFVRSFTRTPGEAVPLRMDERELQALVDRTWARRGRWRAFGPIRALADAHSPDEGALPALIRRYREQNMGQYFEDRVPGARDQRLWAELELAADHVDAIGFIRRYASTHPSTRATTELLFLFDGLVEANRNILRTVQDTTPDVHLRATRDASPDAYRLALDIRRHYQDVLVEKGLRTDEMVTAFYDRARVEVLSGILRTTPDRYRVTDAQLLIGQIAWRHRREADAVAMWCRMAPGESDEYVATARAMLAVLGSTGASGACAGQALSSTQQIDIERALARAESASWGFQYDRLRTFGFRFDTF